MVNIESIVAWLFIFMYLTVQKLLQSIITFIKDVSLRYSTVTNYKIKDTILKGRN